MGYVCFSLQLSYRENVSLVMGSYYLFPTLIINGPASEGKETDFFAKHYISCLVVFILNGIMITPKRGFYL